MAADKQDKVLNVPNLRFPEFSGEWDEYRLDEVMTFPDDRVSSSMLTTSDYVSTENMLQDFQGIVNAKSVPVDINVISFEIGDVLMSNIRPYLKKVWSADRNGGCSADVFVMRAIQELCSKDFLHYLIANEQFISYVMSGAKGLKMPRGDKNQIRRYRVLLPSMEEQLSVSNLFALLDKRIETQIRVIDKLESLISSLVCHLFAEKGDWERTTIGNLLRIGSGKDYKHLKEGNIPVYGTGGLMLYVDDFLYDGDSVCIGRKGTIDKPMFLSGKFWTVDTLFYTYDFKDVIPRFVYYLFKTINWKSYNEASGVPSLSKETIEKIQIAVPELKRQNQICSIVDSVMSKVENERMILKAYNAQKSYLLSQMFI